MGEVHARVPAGDCAVLGHEDENRRTRSAISGNDKVIRAIENCSCRCGRPLAASGGRNGYHQRHRSPIWPVESGHSSSIIRYPEWTCRAKRYSPWIFYMWVGDGGHSRNVRNQISLRITLCDGRATNGENGKQGGDDA